MRALGLAIGLCVALCGAARAQVYDPTTGQQIVQVNGGGGSGTPTRTKPGPFTIVPLSVASVTTGGTAVTALPAGSASAGGWHLFIDTNGYSVRCNIKCCYLLYYIWNITYSNNSGDM